MGEFCVVASPPLQVWSKNFCGRNKKNWSVVHKNKKRKERGKMKNIIKIGSFVVAGTLPTTSQGQVYMCQACPAGTYSDGTQTQCTPCPAGTYSNGGAGSCTKCEVNTIANAGHTQCLSLMDKARWKQYGSVGGGNCQSITLDPDVPYLVYLRGGAGNECGRNCGTERRATQNGAYVEYTFTVSSQTSAQICAGESPIRDYRRAGAGGSWIRIGDKYIVAGGGFGNMPFARRGGGGGGAIGAGGSGDDWSHSEWAGPGGNGGNIYKGGAGHGDERCGNRGEGLDGIGGGRGGGLSGGGDCAGGEGGQVYAHRLFAGYARSGRLGGSANGEKVALSSHNSNLSLNMACQNTLAGCATIYRFDNN